MGAVRLHHRQVGTIRRVVRVSGRFVCGLCRSSYNELPVARGCLQQCTDHVLEMDPVVLKKKQGTYAHHCRFCARDYDTRESAYSCAEECKWKFKRKAIAEAHVTGMDEVAGKKPPPVKKIKQIAVPIVPVRKKLTAVKDPDPKPMLHPRIDEPVLNADANEKPIDISLAPGIAPTQSPSIEEMDALADEKGARRKLRSGRRKPSDMFYRDGARYACTVCQQRYFTKAEVTACYDGHD